MTSITSPNKIQEIKNRFEIVGNSPLLHRGLEVAMKVAPTDMNVLILGESGVGKENFSKIIHQMSKRKHNGFIAINCGAIPAGTIDSELFGHEKGSFTSAHDTRKGYFETVDGGTIFLDEIGELPLETQSRLLRVLESGEFLKVGSSKVQKTDVRVIAATNRDLLEQTRNGKFREDLYYRLSTVTIKIPPLRERKEDIPFLFAKFASDIADKYRVPPIDVTPDGITRLVEFPWPGNIRQLKNFVEQISILETDRTLNAAAIEKYLPDVPTGGLTFNGTAGDGSAFSGFSERELMYKFLFDIKRDLSDVRTAIFELARTLGGNAPVMPQTDPRFLVPAAGSYAPATPYSPEPPVYRPEAPAYAHPIHHEPETVDTYAHPHEEADENLSLINSERDLIRKALQRHGGKRKSAATELGISERTLYRKIKEYGLEE